MVDIVSGVFLPNPDGKRVDSPMINVLFVPNQRPLSINVGNVDPVLSVFGYYST
jgi:hypothetical protein